MGKLQGHHHLLVGEILMLDQGGTSSRNTARCTFGLMSLENQAADHTGIQKARSTFAQIAMLVNPRLPIAAIRGLSKAMLLSETPVLSYHVACYDDTAQQSHALP